MRLLQNLNDKEGITVITPTIRPSCMMDIIRNYKNQTLKNKELIIVINNDEMKVSDFNVDKQDMCSNISIYQLPASLTLGDCLNFAIDKARYKYIAKLDDDDFYAPAYLEEAYNVLKTGIYDVVCKSDIFYYLEEYEELIIYSISKQNKRVTRGAGATICANKNIFEQIPFNQLPYGTDTDFFRRCILHHIPIYSTTCYNFLCFRHKDLKEHTWKITAKELRREGKMCWRKKMTLKEAQEFIKPRN